MIKVIAFVKKRPDISHAEFVRLWTQEHPKVSGVLGASPYRINIAPEAALSGADGSSPPPYDGTAEMYWPDRETFEAALASPEGQAAGEDVNRFAESVDLAIMDEWIVQ